MNYLYATINLSQNLIDYQNIQSLFSVSLLSSLTIPASTTLRRESLIIVNKDNSNNTIDFILDCSATIYTFYIKELFINIKPSITTIK